MIILKIMASVEDDSGNSERDRGKTLSSGSKNSSDLWLVDHFGLGKY